MKMAIYPYSFKLNKKKKVKLNGFDLIIHSISNKNPYLGTISYRNKSI